jgi:hypothetical protein
MNNHTHTQYTSVLRGNPKREKTTEMIFIICIEELHSLEAPNFLCFPAATGRRLQPPSFLGYNLREAPTTQFYGYNHKEATTPYVLWLQP